MIRCQPPWLVLLISRRLVPGGNSCAIQHNRELATDPEESLVGLSGRLGYFCRRLPAAVSAWRDAGERPLYHAVSCHSGCSFDRGPVGRTFCSGPEFWGGLVFLPAAPRQLGTR